MQFGDFFLDFSCVNTSDRDEAAATLNRSPAEWRTSPSIFHFCTTSEVKSSRMNCCKVMCSPKGQGISPYISLMVFINHCATLHNLWSAWISLHFRDHHPCKKVTGLSSSKLAINWWYSMLFPIQTIRLNKQWWICWSHWIIVKNKSYSSSWYYDVYYLGKL